MTWGFLLRVAIKTIVLLALCNLVYAAAAPLETLGRLSLYNTLLPGRERLPYGENPAQSYNLSVDTLPAMFASHVISRPRASDEFRVLLLGDSGTWGWFLEPDQTLAAHLNDAGLHTGDGRRIVVYNLGYPIMSLTKDALLLAEARQFQPDAVVWLVTMASFPREQQLFPPLVQRNAPRVRELIDCCGLREDPSDPRLVEPTALDGTIIGQRRRLADLLRLQIYGIAWGVTGIDQAIPEEIPQRQSDFEADLSWTTFAEPVDLTVDDLAFDALAAGAALAEDMPLLIVNEPMFISSGQNSDLRYNSLYPRWAYDQYRELLAQTAEANGWTYLDQWNAIAPERFTDSPVHLDDEGSRELAALLTPALLALTETEPAPSAVGS